MSTDADNDEERLELALVLGATAPASMQLLRLYIPDRDSGGNEIGNQRFWVMEAARLLVRIGGGVSIEPPLEGGWLNPVTQQIVWERTARVFTWVNADAFEREVPNLRDFLHRLGRETKQGEVGFEFDGFWFRITEFSP